jgi:hypothetical protein
MKVNIKPNLHEIICENGFKMKPNTIAEKAYHASEKLAPRVFHFCNIPVVMT